MILYTSGRFNKIKITVVLACLTILFSGCQSQQGVKPANYSELVEYSEMLSRNRSNLIKLSLGMNKSQVIETMGIFEGKTRNGNVPNPSKSEMIARGSDNFEILFYMTEKYPPFTPIKDSQATPVVLKNNLVIGWGWQFTNTVISGSNKPNIDSEEYVCGEAEDPNPVTDYINARAANNNPVLGASIYTKQILRDECIRKFRMNNINK
jgi:hypothetical protein